MPRVCVCGGYRALCCSLCGVIKTLHCNLPGDLDVFCVCVCAEIGYSRSDSYSQSRKLKEILVEEKKHPKVTSCADADHLFPHTHIVRVAQCRKQGAFTQRGVALLAKFVRQMSWRVGVSVGVGDLYRVWKYLSKTLVWGEEIHVDC